MEKMPLPSSLVKVVITVIIVILSNYLDIGNF